MTTFQDIPDEIRYLIFEKLRQKDLTVCQLVCRSWYTPTHVLFLKTITITSGIHLLQFLDSIDENPHPLYLDAVKSMTIKIDDVKDRLKKEAITNLFCRFRHLEQVKIYAQYNLFNNFDEEICETLLKSCPNLKVFGIYPKSNADISKQCDALLRLQPILTDFKLMNLHHYTSRPYQSAVQFLTRFPRLERVDTTELYNLEELLLVVDRLSRLTNVYLMSRGDDRESFAERYLDGKPTDDEKKQLVNKLSQFKCFDIHCLGGFIPNSVKFIRDYFTQLETLFFRCDMRLQHLSQGQLQHILDILLSVRTKGIVILGSLSTDDLQEYFLSALDNFLMNQKPTMKRIVELNVETGRIAGPSEYLSCIKLIQQRPERKIVVSTRTQASLNRFSRDVLVRADPDVFIVKFKTSGGKYGDDTYYDPRDVIDMVYNDTLGYMPSVKELILDIPSSYKEKIEHTREVYSKIQDLTLCVDPGVPFQSLLDKSFYVFPNLSRLNLYGYEGTFEEDKDEFQVMLPNYELEKLAIDVTFLEMRNPEGLDLVARGKRPILIEVTCRNRRYMFKVALDLSSASKIIEIDANEFTGVFKVHVYVKSLETLQICVYDKDNGPFVRYLDNPKLNLRRLNFTIG